jgi:hypothetical protein
MRSLRAKLAPPFCASVPHFVQFVADRWRLPGAFAKVQSSQEHKGLPNQDKEHKMNVLKNMEAIFLVAAALGTVSTFASAEIPEMRAMRNAQISVEGDSKIAVVTVTAKRLSPAAKARGL